MFDRGIRIAVHVDLCIREVRCLADVAIVEVMMKDLKQIYGSNMSSMTIYIQMKPEVKQ